MMRDIVERLVASLTLAVKNLCSIGRQRFDENPLFLRSVKANPTAPLRMFLQGLLHASYLRLVLCLALAAARQIASVLVCDPAPPMFTHHILSLLRCLAGHKKTPHSFVHMISHSLRRRASVVACKARACVQGGQELKASATVILALVRVLNGNGKEFWKVCQRLTDTTHCLGQSLCGINWGRKPPNFRSKSSKLLYPWVFAILVGGSASHGWSSTTLSQMELQEGLKLRGRQIWRNT